MKFLWNTLMATGQTQELRGFGFNFRTWGVYFVIGRKSKLLRNLEAARKEDGKIYPMY